MLILLAYTVPIHLSCGVKIIIVCFALTNTVTFHLGLIIIATHLPNLKKKILLIKYFHSEIAACCVDWLFATYGHSDYFLGQRCTAESIIEVIWSSVR